VLYQNDPRSGKHADDKGSGLYPDAHGTSGGRSEETCSAVDYDLRTEVIRVGVTESRVTARTACGEFSYKILTISQTSRLYNLIFYSQLTLTTSMLLALLEDTRTIKQNTLAYVCIFRKLEYAYHYTVPNANLNSPRIVTSGIYVKTLHSGATTGGNGGSRLRAPLERGRRVQTAMFFFILFDYKILSRFVAANDTALNTLRPIRPCFTANNNQLGL